jgi:hypothetical protein
MSLLNSYETRSHRAAGRNKGPAPIQHACPTDITVLSQINPDATPSNRQTFAEDFLLEHSATAVHVIKMGMANNDELTKQEASELCQLFGFPS